jgi:RHS repeat-associated protein
MDGPPLSESESGDSIDASTPPVTVTWIATNVGTASGTITSSPAGLNCMGLDVSCVGALEVGSTVTFTAIPAAGATFTGWMGACSGTGNCQIVVGSTKTVIATFAGPLGLSYYHTDILGSVRAITNAAGALVGQRIDYSPFGESTAPLSGDPRRFTGLERDPETAFDYANARYYRNVWGRFTSPDDSVFMDPSDPQSFNRYAYVLNNPLRWVDPSGHAPQSPQNPITRPAGEIDAGFRDSSSVTAHYLEMKGYFGSGGGGSGDSDLYVVAARELTSIAVGSIPIVGSFQSVLELISGQDYITGQRTSRWGAFGGIFAGVVPGGKGLIKASTKADDLLALAQKLYAKKAGKIELHHVHPLYLGGGKNQRLVPLDAAYHQLITNEFRRLAPYGSEVPSAARVAEIMTQVYAKYPLPR